MSNYLAAIDILMCHLGKSFEEACEEVGINPHELRNQQEQSQLRDQRQLDER